MTALAVETGSAHTWSVPGLPGVECFRAMAIRHDYRRHSHAAYSIGVIEAGVGGNEYQGTVHYIPPGHIVTMNPDEAHTGFAAGGQPLSYQMLYVAPEVFEELVDGRGRPCFEGAHLKANSWAQRLRQLHRVLENSPVTLAHQTELAATLGGFVRTFGAAAQAESPQPEPQAIKRLKDYLRANFQRNVRIEELIGLTGWSRAYLIRAFHQQTGLPPHAYLLQVRVEHAKRLLAEGQPLSRVAQEAGFADQSHLNRCFKSLTGVTPRQYAQGHFHSRRAA